MIFLQLLIGPRIHDRHYLFKGTMTQCGQSRFHEMSLQGHLAQELMSNDHEQYGPLNVINGE